MATVILDRQVADELREARAASGADRWDEVWEGTYMMTPLPNNEHQQIAGRLAAICEEVAGWGRGAVVMQGANVSDRDDDWRHNYRCPDVAVYLPASRAKDRGTHWLGGPDFAVEVVSPDDATHEKTAFYARVATRELLIVDHDPWQLELLRLSGAELKSAGVSSVEPSQELASAVLPLTFRLVRGNDRPTIQVTHPPDGKTWNV